MEAIGTHRWASAPAVARDLALSAGLVGAATAIGWALRTALDETDLLLVYLMAVVVAAFRLSRPASVLTALGAVAALNFCFVEPRFTFRVDERRYLVTFAAFAVLGLAVSTLAAQARDRATVAARREAEAQALFRVGRALAGAGDAATIARIGAVQTAELLGTDAWVLLEGEPAPGSARLPLVSGDTCHGVLCVGAAADPEQRHLLAAIADQLALALGREALGRASAEAQRRADAERTRSSLLASVSHDLRTPLAAIAGAASTLQDTDGAPEVRQRLLAGIVEESFRLERLLDNLLQMTRLQDDPRPDLDWQVAQDLAGAAVERIRSAAGGRVRLLAPVEPVLVRCDALLVEQALVNLLENALRYAPGPVTVSIGQADAAVALSVEDRGPGIAPADAARVFERFERATRAGRGAGLGLAIVRAVAHLHGGDAVALQRSGGGATLRLTLPARGPDGADLPAPEPP
ncbi:MAG: DUF4118 domain-containing protein [Myxococcota bacterium]